MNVYLIGYMYCGKTTIGRHLAQRLGYSFVDTDQLFEERYHTSIPLFFQRYGEAAFRQLEGEVLRSTVSLHRHVIACGGGTPCHADNMDFILAHGLSVYLHMDFDDICARMNQSRKLRPLLASKTDAERRDFVRQQLLDRSPFYSQAALTIEAGGLSLDQVCSNLHELVFPRLHSKQISAIVHETQS